MRRYKVVLLTLAVAAPLAAQTPPAITESDYARAERFLAAAAGHLPPGFRGDQPGSTTDASGIAHQQRPDSSS